MVTGVNNNAISFIEDEDGFTVLELLAATSLMAFLAYPLYYALSFSLDSTSKLRHEAEEMEAVSLLRDRMIDWVTAVRPIDPNRDEVNYRSPLVGDAVSLSFFAPVMADERLDVLYEVSLSLSEDGEFSVQAFPDGIHIVEDSEEVVAAQSVLIAGVEEVIFSYLEETAPRIFSWQATWEGKAHLPRALKVEMTFDDEDREWIPLVVPFEVEEWAFCGYDYASADCRSGVNAG